MVPIKVKTPVREFLLEPKENYFRFFADFFATFFLATFLVAFLATFFLATFFFAAIQFQLNLTANVDPFAHKNFFK